MKVLSLRCANGHGFEGWFAGEDEYTEQNGRGLIECPLCADHAISRLPSAPRLNLSGAKAPAAVPKPSAPAAAPDAVPAAAVEAVPTAPRSADLQVAWLQAVREMMKRTEDVGERFTEEARRIHYGETPHRGIRGQASAAQRDALLEEGIEIMAIPVPAALKGPLQ